MSHATTERPAAETAVASGAQRLDIYSSIHRALRLFMTDTLGRVGWLDVSDAAELAATLAQVDALLMTCRHHLDNENRHVHTAIEAVLPGASMRMAGEHVQHEEEIAALQAEVATLRASPGSAQALRLYRHLALFVAENFLHMQVEETAHNEALWAAYGDAEIGGIEQRIVASLSPDEAMLVVRWMTPALPPMERAGWFGAMRQNMPPEVFAGVMDIARRVLDDTAWAKLTRALGSPPVPGLVTV